MKASCLMVPLTTDGTMVTSGSPLAWLSKLFESTFGKGSLHARSYKTILLTSQKELARPEFVAQTGLAELRFRSRGRIAEEVSRNSIHGHKRRRRSEETQKEEQCEQNQQKEQERRGRNAKQQKERKQKQPQVGSREAASIGSKADEPADADIPKHQRQKRRSRNSMSAEEELQKQQPLRQKRGSSTSVEAKEEEAKPAVPGAPKCSRW